MIENCFSTCRGFKHKIRKMSTFFSIFDPRLVFSCKESNFGSRPCLRQAGVMVEGTGGLGEMDLHSRANHY